MLSPARAVVLLIVVSELVAEQFFQSFKREYRLPVHIAVFVALASRGLLKDVFVRWTKMSKSKFARREDASTSIINGLFTVILIKLLFFLLPNSLTWLVTLLRHTYDLSFILLRMLLKLFDLAPLWLIVATSHTLVPQIADLVGSYLRGWFWFTVWLIGGYAFLVFAFVSGIFGVILKTALPA